MGGGGAGWALLCFLGWHVQTKFPGDVRVEAEGEDDVLPDWGASTLDSSLTGEVWTPTSWVVWTGPPPVCEALLVPSGPGASLLALAEEACWLCRRAIFISSS